MASGFPPQPAFPTGLDSDYTLFLVNNTTETHISADNEAWSDEILICPVLLEDPEIWADNGFANLNGELIYYDAVEKTSTSPARVNKLKRCARNLGGKQTKFNLAGSWIRGFVIAEHHNQIVSAVMKIEDFVGVSFDTRFETLDYRIRNLRETPVIFDDFSCPDISFVFEIIENNPSSGILASYNIQIGGSFNSFRLDFGDGDFTTADQAGTHRYSLNSQIDPVVTVTNSKCQIIQSPITRDNPTEPQAGEEPPIFDIPIPDVIDIPPVIVPSITQPKVEIEIPPLLFPCIDIAPFPGVSINIGPINIQVPSIVSFTPINIPSVITITPINIPSFISISPVDISITSINFGQAPSFSPIGFGQAPSFSPISFSPISFGQPPSISPINIDVTVTVDAGSVPSCISLCNAPSSIAVEWGSPPTLNVAFVQGVSTQSARRRKSKEELELEMELGEEFGEWLGNKDQDSFQVEYNSVGIPHEITIKPPEFPDIRLVSDLPHEIRLVGSENIPIRIEVFNVDIPSQIIVLSDIPSIIKVESNIPNEIRVVGLDKIPESIRLDASGIPDSIQVVGFPKSIELKGPESIRLVLDENIEVPLVYRGAPIELKLEMPRAWTGPEGDSDEFPCVRIMPCSPR